MDTLINSELNIVGAVIANQKKNGINMKFLKISLKKNGVIKLFLQVLERLLYKLINNKKDGIIFKSLFNTLKIKKNIRNFEHSIIKSFYYDDEKTLNWIRNKKPDLIVIHTPYWVSKKIRDIVNGNVIGAHPGITQYYRGSHSPFWSIYNNDTENIGYSIFWVDSGIDSGDIIYQEKIIPKHNDSYMSLSWTAMILISKKIKEILCKLNDIDE
ncbi:formyltransferase family protein, partial [Flavobacteriaceae bacterium]|nr:formyltransferase family protein [Flavobacteriaceae bacterium]